MRFTAAFCALVASASALTAQAPSRADSVARADSLARADSIALVRELEALQSASPDSARRMGPGQGPVNPRLIPDISAIGDIVADFSPDGSTIEGGRRFEIREVELALSSAVDPYFRADFFLGISDAEGIAIEEAYATATALPWGTQARIGRFHMPFGKQNTTHRPELHTVEYPHVIQRFLGPEGLKGTGLWGSKIFAPFGFYQEVVATVVDHLGEPEEELTTVEPANKRLSGLGYSARLRNYWDVSEASNVELSLSAATSARAQPILCNGLPQCAGLEGTPGINARQSLVGADFTYRWKPLERGLYKSFIVQAEYIRQLNQKRPRISGVLGPLVEYLGPTRDAGGGYVFSRYQLTRRSYVSGRFDWVDNEATDSGRTTAFSGYLQFFPSEFSKMTAMYERYKPGLGESAINRILLQMTFAVGPHRPHPF
ncbi:MAG TPA: hypothetical protein VNJ04_00990 [Gemmatimonadaceae bacterium]|nr:hypothetical protein [Gemmatimonadaceae bacterium]